MGLGDSLNSLAGGYARGQAQYAANEKTRQEQAQAAAKAAQDAAEFRLKLAQHDQTLMNSAETEWKVIQDAITSDSWSPALLPTILPRAANFDKTYGKIWKGGSATEMLQKALHLEPGDEMEPGRYGPPDQNAANPLMGFVSPEQKYAADERAMKSRSAEAARAFTVQAMDYVRDKSGGLPEEAEFYRRIYDFQDAIMRTGEYDPKTIDEAMDIIRENAAGYYKGLASEIERATGQAGLSDKINEKIEATRKTVSTWITGVLQMDQKDNPLSADLFATRTPIRLNMEADAARWANYMQPNQLIANLIVKYRDSVGQGLNLDPKAEPWAGGLTIAGLPPEGVRAMNRFYDTEVAPNPDTTNPIYVNGKLGMIDYANPSNQWLIWEPTPTPETPSVIKEQGAPFAPVPARGSELAPQVAPQQAPAREVTVQLRDGAAERAARAESASASREASNREKAARKQERMASRERQRAAMQAQQEIADRNNNAFRLYRSGKITEQEFQEELRRAKAGEPSLLEVSR